MAKNNPSPAPDWADDLLSLGRSIQAAIRKLGKLPEDSFRRRDELEAIAHTLSSLGLERLAPPKGIRDELSARCTQLTAEFWQQFSVACQKMDWSLHGTTSRRLLCRAIFVELKGEAVAVEGIAGTLTPDVPTLVERLKPEVENVLPKNFNLKDFITHVVHAYDRQAGASVERPIEDVYRASVLFCQKQGFWRTLDASQLVAMTRPMFRARLTEWLRLGLKTADGRALQFGTTSESRDTWELYSPGEERVVQVGRLGLARLEGVDHA